jgi:hypothetical protein
MSTVSTSEVEVYPPRRAGLHALLRYALHPHHQHSRQWITPLLAHLNTPECLPGVAADEDQN